MQQEDILMRTLVENSPNLVLVHSGGRILYTNKGMAGLLCHPGGEFVDRNGNGLKGITGRRTMKAVLVYLSSQAIMTKEDTELHFRPVEGSDRFFLLKNNFSAYGGNEAIISVLVDITERKTLESYVLNKILETEDRDRKRFATDLHDDLGPLLSSINIHLGLQENLTDPSQYRENIGICKKLIKEAFEKIRIISNNLMPGIMEMHGLDAAIKAFLETLQVEKEFTVNFIPGLGLQRFSSDIELHFFRMVCELIHNSIKHSGAACLTIRLRYSGNCLSLLYSDDGKGYNAEEVVGNSSGMGISNLYYRVNVIGAKLDFLNKQGKTYVRIRKKFN